MKTTKARERLDKLLAGEPVTFDGPRGERAKALEDVLTRERPALTEMVMFDYPREVINSAWFEMATMLRKNPPDRPYSYVLCVFSWCLGLRA